MTEMELEGGFNKWLWLESREEKNRKDNIKKVISKLHELSSGLLPRSLLKQPEHNNRNHLLISQELTRSQNLAQVKILDYNQSRFSGALMSRQSQFSVANSSYQSSTQKSVNNRRNKPRNFSQKQTRSELPISDLTTHTSLQHYPDSEIQLNVHISAGPSEQTHVTLNNEQIIRRPSNLRNRVHSSSINIGSGDSRATQRSTVNKFQLFDIKVPTDRKKQSYLKFVKPAYYGLLSSKHSQDVSPDKGKYSRLKKFVKKNSDISRNPVKDRAAAKEKHRRAGSIFGGTVRVPASQKNLANIQLEECHTGPANYRQGSSVQHCFRKGTPYSKDSQINRLINRNFQIKSYQKSLNQEHIEFQRSKMESIAESQMGTARAAQEADILGVTALYMKQKDEKQGGAQSDRQ